MIQVINRALDILEYLAEEPEKHRSLGEIAEKFELNAGTCANIIKTLVHRKYIDKLDRKQGYALGVRAYELTGNANYKKDLSEAAEGELNALTKKIKENSLLAVLEKDKRKVLVRVMSSHPIQASTSAEKRAYDSSSGRAMIGMLSDAELQKFIKQYGLPKKGEWEGVRDEKSLMQQVNEIRENGYATQMTKENIAGLAVPVYRHDKVIASLSVYMPQFRYAHTDTLQLINFLKQASKRISKKLK